MEQTQLALPASLSLHMRPTTEGEWRVWLTEFDHQTWRWVTVDEITERSWYTACSAAAAMLDYQAELGY